jgi:hypothetical protein
MTTPLPMNPQIRAQWCAALRSGDYKQAKQELRKEIEPGVTGYCCLGVLTDLYVKAANPEEYEPEPGWPDNVWDNDGILAPPVCAWAGLAGANPQITYSSTAADLNDEEEATFAEIADLIDGGAS